MRINEKPLDSWVLANSDGEITSAHCTCMAGLGECCSHIGAILFALETSTRMRKEATVTDVPAYWMFPSQANLDTPYKKVKDMNLESAAKKRKSSTDMTEPVILVNSNNLPTATPTEDEQNEFFNLLHDVMPKASVLSLTDSFSCEFRPKALLQDWPIDFSSLYSRKFEDFTYDTLIQTGSEVDISVTADQVLFVSQNTIGQHKNKFWKKYRVGRITASSFYSVCHTKITNPSVSLLRNICNPQIDQKFIPATKWGNKKEEQAKKVYMSMMSNSHQNFQFSECGLFLNEKYPQFGASPDGVFTCDCCGSGLLEVKCPYSMRDASKLELPWLQLINGEIKLQRNHMYYYQVQMQLFMTKRHFCDFFVWSPCDTYTERIYKDFELWETEAAKAKEFHSKCVMPELQSRYFSRKFCKSLPLSTCSTSKSFVKFCICQKGDDGTKMIMCDNEKCEKQWFHVRCVQLKKIPRGQWFCSECKPDI